MSLAMENVRGVLKFFQDKTGIKGYTTQQKQGAKRPYFYFEPPRSFNSLFTSNITRHRVNIHGVFFIENDEQLREVFPALEHWILAENYRIQCVDESYKLIKGVWLEVIQLNYQKADTDNITFTVSGERFVTVDREEVLIRKINNTHEVKG